MYDSCVCGHSETAHLHRQNCSLCACAKLEHPLDALTRVTENMPSGAGKALRLLLRHGDFKQAGIVALHELVSIGRERALEKGELLVAQGDPSSSVFIILKGRVAVEHRNSMSATAIATLGEGDLVGELSASIGSVHHNTVVANDAVEVLEIAWDRAQRVLDRHPKLGQTVADLVRKRIQTGPARAWV